MLKGTLQSIKFYHIYRLDKTKMKRKKHWIDV